MAYEIFLEHKEVHSLEASPTNKHSDGACSRVSTNRGDMNRTGASYVGIGVR